MANFWHNQELENAEKIGVTISLKSFAGSLKNSLLGVQNTTTNYFKIKSRTILI